MHKENMQETNTKSASKTLEAQKVEPQKPEHQKPKSISPAAFDAPNQDRMVSESRFGLRHLIIGLAGFFILSIILFMLMTKALLITTNTVQPTIALKGGFNLPLGSDRYLVFNGEYEVDISATGFHPKTSQVLINSDTSSNLKIDLAPLPGQIRTAFAMDSNVQGTVRLITPDGIDISIDKIEPANQFLFESIEPGNYLIQADAYLYAPKEQEVEVRGKELTEEISIKLEPNWGYLDINVSPKDAILYAGEKLVTDEFDSNNLESIPVEVGTTLFSLKLEGYKPWMQELTITPEQTIEIGRIILEPVDTELQITTTPSAVSVTVNEQYVGETPLTLDLLPDTNHRIQLFKAGYQSQSHALTLAKNATEARTFELRPDLVDVSISVSPDNAQIKINGVQRGTGSQTISLPSINHQIEVEAAGYESKSLEFLPVKGARQLVQVRLLTDEQAMWANTPGQYINKAGNSMLLFKDAGLVAMGSSRREPGRRANEIQWNANLSRAFYASTTEVTNEEYRRYDNSHSSGHYETIGLDGPQRPVVGISWQQAALYSNWLSEQSGLDPFYQIQKGFVSGVNSGATGYRLLTEAEWSYLARKTPAGLMQKYIWGNSEEPTENIENFADQSIAAKINFVLENNNDGFPASAPVSSFAANDKALYDIGGNVMEWIHDWYQPVPYEGDDSISNPLGPEEGEFHVIRGASWARGYLPQLRLAYRDYDSKGRNDLGFRLARYALPRE